MALLKWIGIEAIAQIVRVKVTVIGQLLINLSYLHLKVIIIKKEYILKRPNDWMDQYFGPGHNKGLGITEAGAAESTPQALAVWYASMIGEFMRHKGELFTPWSWKPCMWEVLHLYGRYNKPNYLPSVSSNDTLVGVHATITNNKNMFTSHAFVQSPC